MVTIMNIIICRRLIGYTELEELEEMLFILDNGSLVMRNSTISNSSNALVINSNHNSQFINTVFTNNKSQAVFLQSGNVFFANSIFFDNANLVQYPPIYNMDGTLSLAHSLIDLYATDGLAGNFNDNGGNFEGDPVFEGSSCHLNPVYSPAIDAGHPNDYDECLPPGQGSLSADIGMYGGMNNCGSGNSNLVNGQADIVSIVDIPQDQGGEVGIQFDGSYYDGNSDIHNVTHYSIWRELDTEGRSDVSFNQTPFGNYFRPNSRTEDAWEYIGDFPAQGFETYGYTATIADSNYSGMFCSPNFWWLHIQIMRRFILSPNLIVDIQ